jgi:hypothetical protein
MFVRSTEARRGAHAQCDRGLACSSGLLGQLICFVSTAAEFVLKRERLVTVRFANYRPIPVRQSLSLADGPGVTSAGNIPGLIEEMLTGLRRAQRAVSEADGLFRRLFHVGPAPI